MSTGGERIAEILKELKDLEPGKWSQQKLAEALGVSRETVNRWVAGTNTPDYDPVAKAESILQKAKSRKRRA